MKKTIVLVFILLFNISAFASTVDVSIQQQYISAKKAYKKKNFKKSYKILSKLYLTKLSDKELNFYLGRSAYETGHYEIALAAYERVQMMDSGNVRNKLEMARTYFMLKMFEDSEALFKDILKNPNLPDNVRRNVEIYVSKVAGAQKKSFTYATINVDWMYDSNVEYGGSTTVFGKIPATSDQALQISADLVNLYDIGDKNGFAIRNKISFYMKDYQDMNDFDVQYLGYTPSLVYSEAKYTAEFAIGMDILTLGADDYLHTLSFMPKFEYSHSTTLRSIAYFKFMKKFFQQSAFKNLDASHYELSYGLQKILSPKSYTQVNLVALTESDDGSTPSGNDIVNYDEYKINAVYANQLTATYGAEVYAEYLGRNYDNYDRDDHGGTISATFNAKIIWDMRLNIKAMYNQIESNQDAFSYKKHTFTAGINKTF